jgi:hypothetical protein
LKMAMIRRHHTLPFGAELVSGGVRFRLWAPRATSVALQLAETILPMAGEPGGWFGLTTDRVAPGGRYRYVVDGKAYPDPASRRQPDGVHGPSEVVDPTAYRWIDSGSRESGTLPRRRHDLLAGEHASATTAEAEELLAALRATYEPLLDGLASHLLLSLPEWGVHDDPRDHWARGPRGTLARRLVDEVLLAGTAGDRDAGGHLRWRRLRSRLRKRHGRG